MAEELRRPAGRRGPHRDTGRQKRTGRSRYLSPPPAAQNASGRRSVVAWLSSPWVWTVILALAGGFQYLRGAPADGVCFTVMLALLVADTFGLLGRLAFRAPVVPRALVIVISCVLGLVMVASPIGSALDRIVLILIGVGIFVLIWPDPPRATGAPGGRERRGGAADGGSARPDLGPHPTDRPDPIPAEALRHTGMVWGVIAVAVCIWELTNFFLGLPSTAASDAHPTISSLVEPFVSWTFGRIVFVALWLLAGLALLRKGRKH